MAFLGAVMFAGKAVIIKYIYGNYGGVGAIPLLTLRMVFSMPLYLLIVLIRYRKQLILLTTNDILQVFGLGIVGYYLASLFDFLGLQYITASMERLILFLYPSLVLIISYFYFGKAINRNQVIALCATYIGIGIAFLPDVALSNQKNILFGGSLVFFSALAYAIYLIGSGQIVKRMSPVLMTSLAIFVSGIIVLFHYGVTNQTSLWGFDSDVYFLSFIMAVFSTVIPSFLITGAMKYIGSSNTSIIGTVGPLATIAMATQFLDEPFYWYHALGTIIIIAGVMIITLDKK